MSETATTQQHPEASDELDLRLLRGRGGHGGLVLRVRVLPAAALLTAVQLLLTGSRLARSWWWQDDLNLLATAAHRPLTLGLLFYDYNGHLIPGSWAIAWLFDRIAPLQWWPAALLTLATVAATSVMMLALLRRLFGDRPAILIPYAMFCSTSLTLTGTLWWAAALQWLPVTLSLVCALWFHVGYLRTGRRADAVGALLSVLFGLLFFEKALTTPVVLALFTVGYGVSGPLWRRPWRAVRRYWVYWLAHAVLAGGFLWLYLSRVTIDTGAASKPADVVELTRLMIVDTLLPSLIGGPLHWITTPATTINAWPGPSPVLVIVACVLTAGAVLGSLVLVPGAWRGWVLLLVWLGISVGLVARARLGLIGTFVGRDHRYLTDAAVMVPLCLALAWLPQRPTQTPSVIMQTSAPPSADVVTPTSSVIMQTSATDAGFDGVGLRQNRLNRVGLGWLAHHGGAIATTGTIAVLVMTVGGVVSGETFMNSWTQNPTQPYIETLSASLAAHPGPVYLFGNEVVPDKVMTPTFLADRQIQHITRPMPVRPQVSQAVPYFSVVDDTGHLHDGTVRGYNLPITKAVCALENKPAAILLPVAPGAGRWTLRLGYLGNRQTTAKVSIGVQPPVTMRLEKGLHEVYISLQAGGSDQLLLSGLDHDASICIGSATLGFPIAKP